MDKDMDKEIEQYVRTLVNETYGQLHDILKPFTLPAIHPDVRMYTYGMIFCPVFPDVPLEKIKFLSGAFRLFWEHVTISDRIVDSSNGTSLVNFFCSNYFLQQSIREFCKVFAAKEKFWYYFDYYHKKYNKAIFIESLKIRHGLQELTYREYLSISANKAAIGKLIIIALQLLSKNTINITPLLKSHDYLYIANQFRDDVEDWMEDHQARRYTYLIRQALIRDGIAHDNFFRQWPDVERLYALMLKHNLFREFLEKANNYIEKSLYFSKNYDLNIWYGCLQDLRNSTKIVREAICR